MEQDLRVRVRERAEEWAAEQDRGKWVAIDREPAREAYANAPVAALRLSTRQERPVIRLSAPSAAQK
jgi:hypothetical protein